MLAYRFVFEDCVANLKALWQSTQRLAQVDTEFLSVDGKRGGIHQNWRDCERLWKALPATTPHPYVLEFVKSHAQETEFIFLNEVVCAKVLEVWTSHKNLAWLRTIPICPSDQNWTNAPFVSDSIKNANSKLLASVVELPDNLPVKCNPLQIMLRNCDFTRAAWSMTVTLEDPFRLNGVVVTGFGRGGRLLGCPTANVESSENPLTFDMIRQKIPAFGSYSGVTTLRGKTYPMVASLGMNPEFAGTRPTLEVHIFAEFDEDFYGDCIDVTLLKFIRSEAEFGSLKMLIFAIQMDCETAHHVLVRELVQN